MTNIRKSKTETVLEIYSQNPALRFLLTTFFPVVGSVLDVTTTQMWHRMQSKRMSAFFEELDRGNVLLTEEHVTNEPFVHCFMVTSRAVVRTNRHEKIAMFALLLESVVIQCDDFSIDEYEELLLILDDLSYREERTESQADYRLVRGLLESSSSAPYAFVSQGTLTRVELSNQPGAQQGIRDDRLFEGWRKQDEH